MFAAPLALDCGGQWCCTPWCHPWCASRIAALVREGRGSVLGKWDHHSKSQGSGRLQETQNLHNHAQSVHHWNKITFSILHILMILKHENIITGQPIPVSDFWAVIMSAAGGTGRPIKTGMGGAPCSKLSKVESLLQWASVTSCMPHSGPGGTTVMLHGGDGASSKESWVVRRVFS